MDIAGGLAGGTMMTVASQTLLAATGQTMSDSPSAIIIGAGPSGIAMAHELKHKLAFEDFTIYEKADEIGGAWATDRSSGCGCDVPTHLCSFSFNLNPNWSKELSDQREVLEYINTTVDKFDLRPHVQTSVEVVKAKWQESSNSWSVYLKDLKTDVEYTRYATILISAVGGTALPHDVEFDGIKQFQGEVLNTAQWPATWGEDGFDGIRGKRVAVVGGCSTARLMPELVHEAAYVKQYAQSPEQSHSRPNNPISTFKRNVFAYLPLYQRLHRLHLFLSNENLTTALLHTLKPSPTTSLITSITPTGIATASSSEDFDVIILAPGCHPTEPITPPLDIIGARDGVSLAQYWRETRGPQAYWGSLVSGFPNFGMISGPNTFATPHRNAFDDCSSPASPLFASEVSTAYLSRVLIAPILDNRATTVSVRQEVEDQYNNALQAQLLRISSNEAHNSNSNAHGRNVSAWPGRASSYWAGTWLRGGRGVVYKGGTGSWWVNMLVRWVRSVRTRTWLLLLLAAVSLRLRAVRRRVDREVLRYRPYEKEVEGYLGPLRDGVGKVLFKT